MLMRIRNYRSTQKYFLEPNEITRVYLLKYEPWSTHLTESEIGTIVYNSENFTNEKVNH